MHGYRVLGNYDRHATSLGDKSPSIKSNGFKLETRIALISPTGNGRASVRKGDYTDKWIAYKHHRELRAQNLVDVALIASIVFERLYVALRGLLLPATLLFHDLVQRSIYVFRHTRSIATHIKKGAFFDPCPNLSRVLHHQILHIDLALLIARECRIELGKMASGPHVFKLLAIQEIRGSAALPEEEPVPSNRTGHAPLMKKGAKGAIPVPGPIMITDVLGSCGKRNFLLG